MILRRNPEVVARREGDKTLVFQQETGWICILNPTSTFIWEQFEGELSAEDLTERICREFTLPEPCTEPEELRGVVDQHLDLMLKGQLLEAVEA